MNTGNKIYNTLVEIYTDTGLSTGSTKPNDPLDPDYIPPFQSIDCAPLVVIKPIDLIGISFINLSSQSFLLENIRIAPSGSNMNYYQSLSYGMLPASNMIANEVLQISDNTDVFFTVAKISKGIRMKVKFLYRRENQITFTTAAEINVNPLDNVIEQLLVTQRILNGSSSNQFKITFEDNPQVNIVNILPIVSAGANKSIDISQTLILTGTAIDIDGSIVLTQWSQVSGPSVVVFSTPNALSTQVNNQVVGVYEFKLSATDNVGGVSKSNVIITVTQPPNPNGLLNILTDSLMPDTSFKITEIKLTSYTNSPQIIYNDQIDKASGVVIKNPLKGTYKLQVTVAGVINNDRSLRVAWAQGAQIRAINLPEANTYTFENVVVDEGVNGVLISFLSNIQANPTANVVFAKINRDLPLYSTANVLPNGLVETGIALVKIDIYAARLGNVPTLNSMPINITKTEANLLTGTSITFDQSILFNNQSEVVIADVQSIQVFDYNAISTQIESKQYSWILDNGEGYLIIQ